MTAARRALDLAHRYGVVVEARGDRLHLTAPKPPPPEVLDALRRHKAEVMPLLAPRRAHKFPSAIALKPLSEIYVTLPGDEWLADPGYALRGRQSADTSNSPWDETDWRAYFDERAAIGEHDGELIRADAEARAFECCIARWLEVNPPQPSGPDRCGYCGVALEELGRDGLPFLAGGGHVWLHHECHAPWYTSQRVEAARALMEMGINVGPNARRT